MNGSVGLDTCGEVTTGPILPRQEQCRFEPAGEVLQNDNHPGARRVGEFAWFVRTNCSDNPIIPPE